MREITGREVHEVYNRVLAAQAAIEAHPEGFRELIVTEWEDVSEENKDLYNRMALHLNVLMREQEAQA